MTPADQPRVSDESLAERATFLEAALRWSTLPMTEAEKTLLDLRGCRAALAASQQRTRELEEALEYVKGQAQEARGHDGEASQLVAELVRGKGGTDHPAWMHLHQLAARLFCIINKSARALRQHPAPDQGPPESGSVPARPISLGDVLVIVHSTVDIELADYDLLVSRLESLAPGAAGEGK